VVALEPVAERMAFIRAAARQDGVESNLYFVEADYLDMTFATRFSVITAIGVLEWSGAFQQDTDPRPDRMLFCSNPPGARTGRRLDHRHREPAWFEIPARLSR